MKALSTSLSEGDLRLEPFEVRHVEPLRAAYNLDPEIWEIYPVNMSGAHFEASFGTFQSHYASGKFIGFAVIFQGELVGLSNYIDPDPQNGVVEIGGTYLVPSVRSSGLNRAKKKLMIEHAFDCGYRKIEWRVDTRNARSQAAVLKLGAVKEGVLRKNRITWTGFVRDTAIFGMMKDEWVG